MNKQDFVEAYVLNFCVAWQVKNYDEFCQRDMHDRLDNPPIEDAIYMGENLWNKLHPNGAPMEIKS